MFALHPENKSERHQGKNAGRAIFPAPASLFFLGNFYLRWLMVPTKSMHFFSSWAQLTVCTGSHTCISWVKHPGQRSPFRARGGTAKNSIYSHMVYRYCHMGHDKNVWALSFKPSTVATPLLGRGVTADLLQQEGGHPCGEDVSFLPPFFNFFQSPDMLSLLEVTSLPFGRSLPFGT